jgi:hexosaminidase
MKFFLTFVLAILILISCTAPIKVVNLNNESFQSKNPGGSEIEISWKLITNNYLDKTQFLSQLNIINKSKSPLNSNWELYFNFSPGRKILNIAELKNIKIEHINGDFFKLVPGPDYSTVVSGDSLSITLIGSAWATKVTDAPCGFYFVFDQKNTNNKPEVPKLKIYPFTNPEQTRRSGSDLVEVPTPETRYLENIRLSLLPEKMLNTIIPTPFSVKQLYSRIELTGYFNIVYKPELKTEAEYLSRSLSINLGRKPEFILNKISEKNNIFLEIKPIELEGTIYEKGSEAYSLKIQNGNIYIEGADTEGVFYAIQSLRALLPINTFQNPSEKIVLDGINITDKPRFKYRGMHLDVARNFQSKSSVLHLLDIMAFYKMNKFHFHLTDDEGWRIEIPGIPELTEIGSKRGHTKDEKDMLFPAYGSGPFATPETSAGTGFYSEQEFIDILTYANERHIEVIPEIEFPGHARAAIIAMKARYHKYTQLGEKAKAEVFLLSDTSDMSVYSSVQNYNDNVICVCQESTYRFFEVVLDNISRMYQKANVPFTTLHIGGDEVPQGAWEYSLACEVLKGQYLKIKNTSDIKEFFLSKVSEILNNKNLITAGWEEIGMHSISENNKQSNVFNPKFIDKNFRLYSWNSVYGWGGEETAYKLANAGYKVVLSNVSPLYLDMAYNNDPEEPGLYWGGFNTEEKIYYFDPYNVYSSLIVDNNGKPIPKNELTIKTKLTDKGKSNIIGIQAQLWSETVKSRERMEYMIFPRLILVAERAWAKEPEWIQDPALYDQCWNQMANSLGQREIIRLNHLDINYRLPAPGAILKDDTLFGNISLPGIDVRYTTDGKDPDITSLKYFAPVKLNSKKIKLRSFSGNERSKIVTFE